MKKYIPHIVVWLVVVIGVLMLSNELFNSSESFRALFGAAGSSDAVVGQVVANSPESLAARERSASLMSMYLFVAIFLMQLISFYVAARVFKNIRVSECCIDTKIKQLDNADIFLDVPLYLGLFGTVSAFLVMTFSPTSSRFIAYSSTIIGIIFSLVLRLALNYPLRRAFIATKDGCSK